MTPDDLFRIVRDIHIDELARSRGSAFDAGRALEWSPETSVRADGIGLDSFERFTVAARLNETFTLYESGVEDNILRAKTLGDVVDVVAAGRDHADERLAFYSGGTTGKPTPRVHSLAEIEQEVVVLTELFQSRRRVIVTVPVHHIYGYLFGVRLPAALGVPAVEARRSLLSGPRRPQSGDLVVAVPFLWERFAAIVASWDDDVVGVSSTAPLDASVAGALCRAGLSSLVEVYGSSETGGVGHRDRCRGADQPFTLFPYWHRDDESDAVLRRTPPSGAGAPPEAGTPPDAEAPPGAPHERVALPDSLRWIDERRFVPTGRRDAVVQVGGENVDLAVLRDRVGEILPEIDECAVRLGSDGRIKAFIATASSATAEEIRSRLRKHLSDAALPATITIGTALPRDATGKITDW